MKLIDVSSPRHPNAFVKVDDEDFERMSRYKWYVAKDDTRFYAIRASRKAEGKNRFTVRMHREIFPIGPKDVIDHIDGDGLNNQKKNLRVCTQKQNGKNRRKQTAKATSIYKGVTRCSGAFKATIILDKRNIYLGFFDNEVDAAIAYNNAAVKYHGDFARLNVIQG